MKSFPSTSGLQPRRASSALAALSRSVRLELTPRFTAFFLLYAIASWGGNALLRSPGVSDIIWPANGLLLAFLLRMRRRSWTQYICASIAINIVVHFCFGFSTRESILFSLGNTIEVLVAASLLAGKGARRLDLTNLRTLGRFVAFGVVLAPLCSSAFILTAMTIWSVPTDLVPLADWFVGDMMGIAVMTPLVLAFSLRELRGLFSRRRLFETVAILGALVVLSAIVFAQDGLPVDFLLMPALLVAIFRLGRTGAAIGIILITAPAVYMTERAHGAFSLTRAGMMVHSFFILQLFLCVMLVILYSVSSALHEKDRLQREATAAFYEADANAGRDHITGLANRRAFDRKMERAWRTAILERSAISLLMIDVDQFKLYNDRYGHVAGDLCLRRIGDVLAAAALRTSDLTARYGGEEFAVILPRAIGPGSAMLAERIRQAVEEAHLTHEPYSRGVITVSVGVATMEPEPGTESIVLITRADRALYRAKESGRNKVVVWEQSG